MAESIIISTLVEAIVSQAVERLTELLFNEVASLSSVRNDVEHLREELERIQCFLEDADRKQEQDKRVRHWIAEVKDVAYDIEDVIEIFISKASSSFFKVLHFRKLRKQINSIQDKMDRILESTQKYQIKIGQGTSTTSVVELQRNLRRSSPYDPEDHIDYDHDHVISLEDSIMALIAELLKKEDRLCVVAVVGMGGLGKTTLAKIVYNHRHVKQHFDCCAWVFISQQYVSRDVLYEILVQIERNDSEREKLRNLNVYELSDRLKHHLKGKKYFVVVDDIWSVEAWDSVKKAFPKGEQGSKVLFTTRNKEVAMFADPCSFLIEPPFLTIEESWELLKRKAFQTGTFNIEYSYLPEFEKLGKDMVKKCGGLPLGIIILGGLLKTKNSLDGWKEVQKDVNSYLNKLQSNQIYEGVHGILALSYYDLPYYLKPCFLYLGSFSEDKEIPKKTLIQLWIAEGFVQMQGRRNGLRSSKETIEDVAEQYLGELVERFMIQVSTRNKSGIGVKTYKLHDLMRDFCLSKSKEENFFEIMQQYETNMPPVASSIHHQMPTIYSRRISIYGTGHGDFDRYQVQTHIRSLMCFETISSFPMSFLRKNFMLLRVLEFGFGQIKVEFEMLKEICQLVHLRHLGLRRTDTHKLPSSIGNLRSLYTFDLRENFHDIVLPSGISRLKNLTHLLTSAPLRLEFDYFGIMKYITENQVVSRAEKFPNKAWIGYDSLIKLTNLQNLNLKFHTEEEARKVFESPIIQSGHLRSLYISFTILEHSGTVFPSMQSLSHCQLLSKLVLKAKINPKEHNSFQFLPQSLTKLTLEDSVIGKDSMALLEKLPHLRLLRLLSNAYSGSQMVCSAGGFSKLETLHLYDLISLKEWRVERNAMSSLKRLHIESVPQLTMIPDGLQYITTLQQLTIKAMPHSFVQRLRQANNRFQMEGEDYYKVRHISSISFDRNVVKSLITSSHDYSHDTRVD